MKNLNKVMLIGNVVKEPELKYTPSGSAVCTFTVATNRTWKDANGGKKEEATFTRVVAWSKLGEIVSQYTRKGSKVYVEGRITNRTWKDDQGVDKYITEVIANELILLDNKGFTQEIEDTNPPEPPKNTSKEEKEEPVDLDDLNFDDLTLDDL